jgi:hypothetical protein
MYLYTYLDLATFFSNRNSHFYSGALWFISGPKHMDIVIEFSRFFSVFPCRCWHSILIRLRMMRKSETNKIKQHYFFLDV